MPAVPQRHLIVQKSFFSAFIVLLIVLYLAPNARTWADAAIEERIRVLERIVTENKYDLKSEINSL